MHRLSLRTLAALMKTERNQQLGEQMATCRERIEHALDCWLPETATMPTRLHEAMRYTTLTGGKYIRPLLVYATGRALAVDAGELDGPACAVELIHAYSLIHDDLPAMDDDDLRRGKASCHRAFGEAIAILSGDALQSLAFHILSHDPAIRATAQRRLRMIDTLAVASGSLGMAGGQAIDLESVGKALELTELENMHLRKTGALIRASVTLAALAKNDLPEKMLHALGNYAHCIGLAFQVQDDILDIEGTTELLGKTQGVDIIKNKPTYPALLGLDGAKQQALQLHCRALEHLAPLGETAAPLRWISEYIIHREY